MRISSYACTVKGDSQEPTIINTSHARKARLQFYRDVVDCHPVRFIDVRVRRLGDPHTCADFERTAAYRGMPGLKCGQPVTAHGMTGHIVGHNNSANFNVLFGDGKLAGETYNVHPSEITLSS